MALQDGVGGRQTEETREYTRHFRLGGLKVECCLTARHSRCSPYIRSGASPSDRSASAVIGCSIVQVPAPLLFDTLATTAAAAVDDYPLAHLSMLSRAVARAATAEGLAPGEHATENAGTTGAADTPVRFSLSGFAWCALGSEAGGEVVRHRCTALQTSSSSFHLPLVSALRGEPLAQATASKTDETVLSWHTP